MSLKPSSTLFLKLVVLLIGLGVLALCVCVLPLGIQNEHADGYRPLLIGMYVPAIPFFIALYQVLKLLHAVDRNQIFSEASVKPLKYITSCGLAISAMYGLALPYIYMMAQSDDAPGVMLLGLIFTVAPLVVAVFAANLQQVLQNVIQLKAENELTV